MGREIKRVPLDFDWPIDKVWQGFLLPAELEGKPCTACNASGQTHFGWWLQHMSYLMGMLARDVRDQEQGKPMHPWLTEFPHGHGHWEYPVPGDPQSGPGRWVVDRPGEDALQFFANLTGKPVEEIGGWLGSNAEQYIAMRKLLEIADVDVTCAACGGEGSTERFEGQKARREAWYDEPHELHGPPPGLGWQMWETVSEGSPVSPVFPTAEGLAQWLTTPEGGRMAGPSRRPFTIEQARGFVAEGWAPTGFITAGGVHDGAAYVGADRAVGEQMSELDGGDAS